MAMKESIHGLEEYLNFHYTFTFSTIVAMIPWIYMVPTWTVMLMICRAYLSMNSPPMDRHIFICIALNFLFSTIFFLANYIRITLPATGIFTSWCASIEPNHFLKTIFIVCFYCNYCVLMLPLLLCFIRLTILFRPRDNNLICPKILKLTLPLLVIVPLGCTAFMIPAVGYCREMGPPLAYGAVYIYYSGGWDGWRNSYIFLVTSVVLWILTIASSSLTMFKLHRVATRKNNIPLKTKQAKARAETSLTIAMIASMIPFINNVLFTIVYLYLTDYTYYLLFLRPFGNDVEIVTMPWILFLTHPMMRQRRKKCRISTTSTL